MTFIPTPWKVFSLLTLRKHRGIAEEKGYFRDLKLDIPLLQVDSTWSDILGHDCRLEIAGTRIIANDAILKEDFHPAQI